MSEQITKELEIALAHYIKERPKMVEFNKSIQRNMDMCFNQEARAIESVEMLRDSIKKLDDVRNELIERLIEYRKLIKELP
jgi:hypothetical protein